MILQKRGRNISKAEIVNISGFGIWLYTDGKEYFLPYEEYPWFYDAKIREIQNVQLIHGSHLRWPDLDIDLEIDSLENPEKYPLIYKPLKQARR
jgi:hypothetical protein